MNNLQKLENNLSLDRDYRYATVSEALEVLRREQLLAPQSPRINIPLGQNSWIRGVDKKYYATQISQLHRLEDILAESDWRVAAERLKEGFDSATDQAAYLDDVLQSHKLGFRIRETATNDTVTSSFIAFYFHLIDYENPKVRERARHAMLANLPFLPNELRERFFNEWAVRGPVETILKKFDSEDCGKLAIIEGEVTLKHLRALASLPYEVSLSRFEGAYLLVRGTPNRVVIPYGARKIRHTHPDNRPEALWPSTGSLRNILGDFHFSREEGYGAIITPLGIVLYTGDSYSCDSYKPFAALLTEEVRNGAKAIKGKVFFQQYYKTREIPIIFLSWDILERLHQQRLLPTSSSPQRLSELLLDSNNSLDKTGIHQLCALTKSTSRGPVFHPDTTVYSHQTGSYWLEVWK